MNSEISILIGGKAGFGIDTAGLIIARILSQMGLFIYIYRDYPSLIRGGHTFSIVRASSGKISAHSNKIDFLLALNQDTLEFHRSKLKNNAVIIYDSDSVKIEGLTETAGLVGLPIGKISQEEKAPEIMRNTCIIGSFAKAVGISWEITEKVLRKNIEKEVELNLKIARRGYEETNGSRKIDAEGHKPLPVITGNDAIGLGLIKAGIKTYIAYPMTPSSGVLHFMANQADNFNLKVLHPESEISVILMALGAAYMGERVAVGTSGGGFCLMTEGLSLSGMAELPIAIVVAQRPGPSTGLPTYTAQTDLHFVLNAGQGEFTRLVVAPGDAEEAYYWSAVSLNISWKYQIPAIILIDKTLGEGVYSFDMDEIGPSKEESVYLWDKKMPYKRYLNTETGISNMAFPTEKDVIVKTNSYEHDEYGITTEDAAITKMMQDKRLRKEKYLSEDMQNYKAVGVYGNNASKTALLCWGSNKGVCIEAAAALGLKVIHLQVLWPFPLKQFKAALEGTERLICLENNASGQLIKLIKMQGFDANDKISKYDGRPFYLDDLLDSLNKLKIKG